MEPMQPQTPPPQQPNPMPQMPPAVQPQQPPQLPPEHHDHRKSLVISLIVAAVLLIAAIGIAAWLFTKNSSSNVVENSVPESAEDVKDVKKVSFVQPANMPAQYVKRDQSTATVSTIYYFDDATNCGVTTSTLTLGAQAGTTPKDAIVNSAKTAESLGVKTIKSTDSSTVSLKDVQSGKAYTFNSLDLEQQVEVQGVNFKKQFNTIAYKQFGQQVASIGYSCKDTTWADKKAELLNLVSQFKVKTEK